MVQNPYALYFFIYEKIEKWNKYGIFGTKVIFIIKVIFFYKFRHSSMILYCVCKGGNNMKKLSKDEIIEFTNKYFPMYKGDIKSVSYFEYNGITEYLVNDHYLFLVKNDK